MTETRPNPIIRVFPSLTDVAFLMPLLFLFVRLDGVKTMLGDGDTGWHIRTGEWILANGKVPLVDMFSYTKPGEPWFAWEWLWDVIFAYLHQHAGGLAAVVFVSILVICLTSGLLFRLVRRRVPNNPVVAIAATIAACAGASLHWLARPHLFTMLFLVIFLSILDRVDREQRYSLLRWLPALMVLWTNLHGGFLLGILILLAYIGGELAAAALSPVAEVRKGALHRAKLYAYAAGGCVLATVVNPYFWKLHVHLYKYLTDPFQYQFITEFYSFNFHHPTAPWVEGVLWLAIIVAVRNASRGEYISLCLVAGLSHIALMAARNVPLFMIAVAPVIAQGVDELLVAAHESQKLAQWVRRVTGGLVEASRDIAVMDGYWRLYPLSVLVMAVLALLIRVPSDNVKLSAQFDPKRYPAKAVEMLLKNDMGHRIFTDDEWGDFLIYKTYPQRLVFVDGRSDFYGGPFDEKFLDVLNVKYGWEEYLKRYQVDTVLLSTSSPLAGAMKESRNWRPVYDDTVAIVFRPTAPASLPARREERRQQVENLVPSVSSSISKTFREKPGRSQSSSHRLVASCAGEMACSAQAFHFGAVLQSPPSVFTAGGEVTRQN